MIVNHNDFTTPDNAAAWVRGASISYFLEKSSFKKEFDPEGTAKFLIENAEEYRTKHDDIESWHELGKSFMPGVSGGRFYEKQIRDELKEHIFNAAKDDPTIFLSDVVAINFEYPCDKYPEFSEIQYEAVKAWGRLMAGRTEQHCIKCNDTKR